MKAFVSLGHFLLRITTVKVFDFEHFWPRIPMVKVLFFPCHFLPRIQTVKVFLFLGHLCPRLPTVKVFGFLAFLSKDTKGESFFVVFGQGYKR